MSIIRQSTRNGLLLTASKLEPPNPHCYVCKQASLSLTLNTEQWTLEDLLTKVIKKDMGFEEPSLMLGSDFIWEEGEDADTATFGKNLSKKLTDLPCGGIRHGTVLVIEDFSQDLDVSVTFTHKTVWEKEGEQVVTDEDYMFVLSGNKGTTCEPAGKPKAEESNGTAPANGKTPADDDDDDDEIVVVSQRKRSSSGDAEHANKKQKTEVPDDEVIMIDD